MSVLLISHDPSGLDLHADPVLRIVRQYKYLQLTECTYAIETDEKTRTVFNKIMPCLGENVQLLVVTLVKPFAGPLLGPVSIWLAKHLPEA